MSGFAYVGKTAAATTDVVRKIDVDTDYANATVSQGAVAGQIATAVAAKASATATNTAVSAFAQPNYYQAQDALLLPSSSVGIASVLANPNAVPPTPAVTGVASLDGSGKIPTAQVPVLGAGYLSGPWGPTAAVSASAVTVPIKFADWNIGAAGLPFQPVVFMSLLAKAINRGRPVVEVWINNGPMAYGTGTLVARGVGRNYWNDKMTVNVVPVPSRNGQLGGTGYAATYTTWLTAWLYDSNGQGVNVTATDIVNAGVFLMRYQG